mgnify:CR=1 FL=1
MSNKDTFKIVPLDRLIEKFEMEPELSYKHTKYHFNIYAAKKKKDTDGNIVTLKKREVYSFPRNRCRTRWEQFDWIHQVLGKVWMTDTFKFVKSFHEAIEDWFDIKITDKDKEKDDE